MSLIIISSVKHLLPKSKHDLYKDYEDFIEENNVEKTSIAHYKNILHELRNEVSFEPFIDIIKGQNNLTKEKVIEKLSNNISANSVRILKIAISDPSGGVRLSAANGLLKIEEVINGKIQLAVKMTKERGSAKDFSDLGDIYRMYANIGLMEASSYNHYMNLTCQAYKQSLDIDTNQVDVVIHYAQSLISIKDYEKANRLLDHAIKTWPDNNDIILLRAESCFHLHKINEIKESLYDLTLESLSPDQRVVAEYWTQKC